MLSADILAEGVRGLVPNPFGIAANKHTLLYVSLHYLIFFFNNFYMEVNLKILLQTLCTSSNTGYIIISHREKSELNSCPLPSSPLDLHAEFMHSPSA